jgi:PGF-pre-PGF domain-containing protein
VGTSESESDIWDSGKILNISSTDISYAGSDLELNTTYYWRVRTWDNNNAAGPYCDVQTFTTTGSEGPIPLPVADFTANVTSGAVPLTITFTDGSSNEPTNWAWDFGDGNTSTDQDPIYIYTSVGTYTVSLNTTNAGGYNITTKVDYILVTVPAPVADFTADVTSGAVPLAVNFTDQSTNTPTSWLWNFGDGANSTEQNPTHIYDSAGTYTVSLNATNVGGSNISTQTDYITAAVAPITSFTADVTSGAVPLSVNFADQSTNTPTSWLWNFGDGANSTEQNPTHTYASAGTYTVSLNATNVGGSNTSIQTDHITAAITPVAGFTSDVTSGAVPLSVNFTDQSSNSPTSWFWDFGDGINSTEQDPNHVYTSVGIYNVSLNVTNAGGSNTSMQTAYITAAYVPVANFTADVTSGAVPLSVNFTDLSSNNPISWLWDFGDGDNSTDQHPIHTYAGAGIYNVSLNVTNMGGSNILIQAAYINAAVAPVANFTADVTSGTAPLAVYFADQSTNTPTSWAWNFGDGTTSTEQDPAHTYTSAGTYNVSLNAANAGGSNVSTQAGYITVTSGSSGGSDSGRRTSVSPGQPPESTTSTYTAVKHVMGGTSIEYDLSGTGSPVLGISFDAKDNEGAVVAKVQALSDSPEGITNPPGNPYQMMSIDVGSQGTISSHNADNIMINFRVSWEWIRENNIDPATIRMTRYHDGEWQELPTGRVSDDGEYLYFAAETTGFSIFSIVGDKLVLATEGEANVPQAFTEEATEVPASTEDKSTPGFTAEIGLVFLSLAFLADRKYGR